MHADAADLDTLYSLLVLRNDYLVAEAHVDEVSMEQQILVQSASKSYYSALVGIALDQGCLTSMDEKSLDFFPEFADQIADPRRQQISLEHLLQMRSGWPWDESAAALWEFMLADDFLPPIVGLPLVSHPGAEFHTGRLELMTPPGRFAASP